MTSSLQNLYKPNDWLVIQLGSREHYAIPRALHDRGHLRGMLTDVWVSEAQSKLIRRVLPQFSQRRSEGVPDHLVKSANLSRIALDAKLKLEFLGKWDAILSRNEWFQKWATNEIARKLDNEMASVVFGYSYAARLPFKAAKARGAKLILGQIDPGPLEHSVVDCQTEEYRQLAVGESAPPQLYWEHWWEEVHLADLIVVNSSWSTELLMRAGVQREKIFVCPLAYLSPSLTSSTKAKQPLSFFTKLRPLKILFLGQVILRKGIGQLFDAIHALRSEFVHFTIAGPIGVNVPDKIKLLNSVTFLGAVDRFTCSKLYREADIFILPTLSDGFAITQLEALAHGVPVLSSRFCGDVVEHGKNGWLMNEVSPQTIVAAIQRILQNPNELLAATAAAHVGYKYSIPALSDTLERIGNL